jgi:transposase
MDLAAFYGAYRQDGHGRAAFDPAVMVAVLLYAYARGIRSSRAIERACEEDVAFRVLAAHQVPDHTTIARFRQRHQDALARLFGEVLALCADAGPVCADVLAVDGTKIHANASERASCDYERLAREVLADADAIDAAEDERFGDQRGDELPEPLGTRQGRAKWLADAKRRLEERRAHEARAIPASRPARLREAKRRLEEEHRVEVQANAAYEAYRARGVDKTGRKFGGPPKPFEPPATPAGKINTTDPDSRNVKTLRGWAQGYNAQAVSTDGQIVIAAELTNLSADFGQLGTAGRRRSPRAARRRYRAPARRGARRCRLLASRSDAGARRRRHHGAHPTRRQETPRHPPGLERRPLRLHAAPRWSRRPAPRSTGDAPA